MARYKHNVAQYYKQVAPLYETAVLCRNAACLHFVISSLIYTGIPLVSHKNAFQFSYILNLVRVMVNCTLTLL